ncbi:division plane positioning ATPase MipZ [Parafrankia sp. BMG5.11]|uniref:division plane positioning ATPase MipZ n=1 Tax=Parafrankia sp. BMG5.11 TaxID=222540 RepID=UPI0035A12BAB
MHDLLNRRLRNAHVIAFASEKGGVGKSTLAFHCAVALTHQGCRVLTIDCDRRQQTLHRILEARDRTTRTLKVDRPRLEHVVFEKQSVSLLLQEIERLGRDCDFVVIDLPGHDSPIARRTIALAHTVITPTNCSPADRDALGSIAQATGELRQASPFAQVVVGLPAERLVRVDAFDWVVAKNRIRRCEQRLIASVERDLNTMERSCERRSGLVSLISSRCADPAVSRTKRDERCSVVAGSRQRIAIEFRAGPVGANTWSLTL